MINSDSLIQEILRRNIKITDTLTLELLQEIIKRNNDLSKHLESAGKLNGN
jgi:hypothetical protein